MRFIQPSFKIMQCPDGEEVLALLERAARTCYKSEKKIYPGEPDWDAEQRMVQGRWKREPSSHRLVRKVLELGHHSVIEHMVVTVRFICNRGVSHELVRHRIGSFSQESSRYCNYSKEQHGSGLNIIEPSYRPAMPPYKFDPESPQTSMDQEAQWTKGEHRRVMWELALRKIEDTYLKLIELGEKPELARDILPIGLKTEVVTTFNLREWRHVFTLRALNKRAHPQIRELMLPLLHCLAARIPIVFDDLVAESERRLDAMDVLPLWRSTMETE
ncbi:MAG: FAD-dependent thymidylate synthase [Deltaproteobacteria bacterium]|nr:FAD-dependent thymidylate synthase [Deltaproteobacteria bacterium]